MTQKIEKQQQIEPTNKSKPDISESSFHQTPLLSFKDTSVSNTVAVGDINS